MAVLLSHFRKSRCKGIDKSTISITFPNGSSIHSSSVRFILSHNTLASTPNPRKPRETKNSQSSQTESESPGSSQKHKIRNGTNAKSPTVSPSRPTVGLQILSSKIYERFTFVRITTAATTCCYTSPMAAPAVVLLQSHHTL